MNQQLNEILAYVKRLEEKVDLLSEQKNITANKDEDALLTEAEASSLLRITRTTLWKKRVKDEIPYLRVSRNKVLYKKSDLLKFFKV